MWMAWKGQELSQGAQGIFWRHSHTATGPFRIRSSEG